jgi:nucleotide-binding universal stress UspA family protein
MSKANKIILPTDFSDASLKAVYWATEAARQFDADIHVITSVQAPMVFQPTMAASYPSIDEMRKEAEERLDSFIKEHLSEVEGKRVRVVVSGRPADEIVRYAKEVSATMIVMATHGYSGLAHIVIGSTTENVVRHATCPVLSIRE